jgi:hypothetical protein
MAEPHRIAVKYQPLDWRGVQADGEELVEP